jgi:hypothetical protein
LEQGFIVFSGAAQQLDATLCTARTLEKFDPPQAEPLPITLGLLLGAYIPSVPANCANDICDAYSSSGWLDFAISLTPVIFKFQALVSDCHHSVATLLRDANMCSQYYIGDDEVVSNCSYDREDEIAADTQYLPPGILVSLSYIRDAASDAAQVATSVLADLAILPSHCFVSLAPRPSLVPFNQISPRFLADCLFSSSTSTFISPPTPASVSGKCACVQQALVLFTNAAETFLTSEAASTSQPCDWFNAKRAEWQKTFQFWRKRQKAWKTLEWDRGGWAEPPPFSQLTFEDWALLSIRYELHLLMHAYRKVHHGFLLIGHLPSYYLLHFHKEFSIRNYGFNEVCMLAAIILDTVALEGKSLVPVLPEDANLACFMQITEDHRCARSRRIDAGDNSALLDFAAILLR